MSDARCALKTDALTTDDSSPENEALTTVPGPPSWPTSSQPTLLARGRDEHPYFPRLRMQGSSGDDARIVDVLRRLQHVRRHVRQVIEVHQHPVLPEDGPGRRRAAERHTDHLPAVVDAHDLAHRVALERPNSLDRCAPPGPEEPIRDEPADEIPGTGWIREPDDVAPLVDVHRCIPGGAAERRERIDAPLVPQ